MSHIDFQKLKTKQKKTQQIITPILFKKALIRMTPQIKVNTDAFAFIVAVVALVSILNEKNYCHGQRDTQNNFF